MDEKTIIGTAKMLVDGSIELWLHTIPPDPPARTMGILKAGTELYTDVLERVGGLTMGETKLVPAWV